ncbi:MAG: EAL domain-containing protein [Desulfuromonadales bacterium]|nr:EAL domain-containing protein [Desulfuromonadales bacterium]
MLPSNLQASCWRLVLPAMLFWSVSGAVILCAVAAIERYANGLPVDPAQLMLPALLGALAGMLFGRSEIRLGRLGHRLRESEKRLQALYRNTPAMLHSLDANGRLVYVSQTWLDTLGYRHDQVSGRPFSDFIVADDPTAAQRLHLQTLCEQGEVRDARYRLRCADGREIDVALTEVRHADQTGAPSESLAVLTDLTQQLAAEDRVEKLAYCDSLTGLPNRALLNDRLLHAIAQARRDNRQVGLFFFDLDRFKMINDTQGHAVGDLVLRSVAQRLKKFIREGDTFARLGGDEFVIVQADPNQDPNFAILARRILETLGEPFQLGEREFYTTASIGVAVYPHDGDDPQALLKSADTAMYVAKGRGRNNYQFFSGEMNAQAVARADLANRLRQALHNQELTLHYQPQIELASGRIVAVEALLRWHDHEGRLISPSQIISVAEESGLIFPLGEWTLEAACRQAHLWREAGLPPLRMAVNLSGHHIRQANFIDRLEMILESTAMEWSQLEVELNETSVMSNVQEIIMSLTDLKVHGIHLAIDDFGTGYSSLLYLKHFPIERIKIAQEFISDIDLNPDYATITEAIISMTRSLGLAVTAVGVENAWQLEFLRSHGCTEVAGTFLSPALPPEDIARLLLSNANLLVTGSGDSACQ